MCRKVLLYFLNSKKLNWLERKMPNPYAVVWDKVDKFFSLMFISILGSLFFFIQELPCPIFLLEISFVLFFLSIIRHIKSVPGDTEQVIMKPLLCYQLIVSTILLVFGLIQMINCLMT